MSRPKMPRDAAGRARFLAALVLFAGLVAGGCDVRPSVAPTPRSRESAIPAGAVKQSPSSDPSPPILHSNEWQSPVPVPGAVNTAGAEDSPFVTPDGATLYFFFTPDLSVPPEKQLVDGVTGIYVSRSSGGAWGKAERVVLQTPGKLALDGCPFVQADTMWFCSAREGYSGVSLFTARFVDGKWGNWQSASGAVSLASPVGEMHITADGRELYFHRPGGGSEGHLDIWVSSMMNGRWQAPANVSAVNSPESDGYPFVSQDGSELWFTRTYKGSPAVFRAKRSGGEWTSPELIVSQLAGEPTLDVRRNLYFVHHYLRDGKLLEADLYVAYRR